MRFLVTGGRGQLGATLAGLNGADGNTVVALGRGGCDVTDAASVRMALATYRPDVVINCAAWTQVDAAETHGEAAWALNAVAPGLVARECAEAGVLVQHISTDYVFSGEATMPIPEDAIPAPRSAYGRGKLAGELAVRNASDRAQIVRTSWLYGADGPNFVLTMLRLAASGASVRVVADQQGSPTWTGHLAPVLLRLAARGVPGTFHLTNSGSTTWCGFADAVFAAATSGARAVPITTLEYPTAAVRPAYSVLENAAWRMLGETPLPDWRAGVTTYVASLGQR